MGERVRCPQPYSVLQNRHSSPHRRRAVPRIGRLDRSPPSTSQWRLPLRHCWREDFVIAWVLEAADHEGRQIYSANQQCQAWYWKWCCRRDFHHWQPCNLSPRRSCLAIRISCRNLVRRGSGLRTSLRSTPNSRNPLASVGDRKRDSRIRSKAFSGTQKTASWNSA